MSYHFRILILLFTFAPVAQLAAQEIELKGKEDPSRQVHWAMGAYFGTGWYQVDSNRSMYIFRIPTRQTLSTSSIDEQGEREFGVEILYPLTFGLHTLDELPDFIDFDNFATISFTPGFQIEIPVTQKWHLRPYAHFGWGTETHTSDTAWIYYGGIKSRYRLDDRLDGSSNNWSLLNGLYYAGYQPEFKSRGKFASFMSGMEYSLPLKGFDIGGDDLRLNAHLTYNYFFNKLNFHIDEDKVESVTDQWELGLALAKDSKKLKIWFISFEHIGLSYKWSTNGTYRAISVNVRSPFTF